LSHVLQGIDLDAALSLAGEPNWQQGVGDSLGEILKAQPPPYVSGLNRVRGVGAAANLSRPMMRPDIAKPAGLYLSASLSP
jgi:hypothetical protein